MENPKCSQKKHIEFIAISFCFECNLYLCNKCKSYHSELFDNHHIYNLDKNLSEVFTGLCIEPGHKVELKYYCKNHNILCCAACISKIKDSKDDQHKDCNVVKLDEIKEEKRKMLKDNIKYLEKFSNSIENSINQLKKLFEDINESQENLKIQIAKIFTKLRNEINDREDEILLKLDDMIKNFLMKKI